MNSLPAGMTTGGMWMMSWVPDAASTFEVPSGSAPKMKVLLSPATSMPSRRRPCMTFRVVAFSAAITIGPVYAVRVSDAAVLVSMVGLVTVSATPP